VTERTDPRPSEDRAEEDLADTGAERAPAEGGREEVADLPGADTAGDEPPTEKEDH
jgi:hypothetical protein